MPFPQHGQEQQKAEKEKAEKARLAKVQRDKEIQDSIAKSRAKENELEEINNMPNQSKAYRKRTGSTTNK